MSKKIIFTLSFFLALVCSADDSQIGFNPGSAVGTIFSDDDVIARVSGGMDGALELLVNQGVELSTIQLPDATLQVDQIKKLPNRKLLVIGSASGVVRTVSVVDVAGQTVIDSFLAYAPAISPDRKKIAYVRFYAPHGPAVDAEQYRVYDLSLSADNNRVNADAFDRKNDVGFSIDPNNPQLAKRKMSSNGFAWSADSTAVNYIVKSDDNNILIHASFKKYPSIDIENYVLSMDLCKNMCGTLIFPDIKQRGNTVISSFRSVVQPSIQGIQSTVVSQ